MAFGRDVGHWRRSVRLRPAAACVAAVWCAAQAMGQPERPASVPAMDEDRAVLAKAGVEDTNAGYLAYLKSLDSPEMKQEVDKLVQQLGDPAWKVREEATERLALLGPVAYETLAGAASSKDVEVQLRAKLAMEKSSARVLSAVLGRIAAHKTPGGATAVAEVLPVCRAGRLEAEARRAIQASARAEDLPALRDRVRNGTGEGRELLLSAMLQLPSVNSPEEVRPLLADKDNRVALAAARTLAEKADRECLAPLVRLMDCDDASVRAQAHRLLEAVAGRRFAFVSYDSAEARAKAMAPVAEWLGGEGKTAKLVPATAKTFLGRTLVCLPSEDTVMELDAKDKTTFKQTLAGVWGCHGLPNGHRLFACTNQNTIVEYDAAGKECWRHEGLVRPQAVQRLDNGNTLVACAAPAKVVEVTPDGKIAWEAKVTGSPSDARRLDNGNTLITDQGNARLFEVNARGQEVWKIENLRAVRSAERLPNGNTLAAVTGEGKAVEFTPEGKRVWSSESFNSPKCAQRLPDGNTLITDADGIREVTLDGKVVWENRCGYVGMACRY